MRKKRTFIKWSHFSWVFPTLFQTLTRPIVRQLLRFFCNLEVKGLENLEKLRGKPYIICPNHIHELDGFLIPATIPLSVDRRPFFPVSRGKFFYRDKGLRSRLYGGHFFSFMGAYPVRTGLRDYRKSLVNQIEIIEEGYPVLIFPEGKVRSDEHPKGGAAYLSDYTQVPIVPFALEGIDQMGYADFFRRNRHLTIHIGEPIYPDEMFKDSFPQQPEKYKIAAKKIMDKVHSLRVDSYE